MRGTGREELGLEPEKWNPLTETGKTGEITCKGKTVEGVQCLVH